MITLKDETKKEIRRRLNKLTRYGLVFEQMDEARDGEYVRYEDVAQMLIDFNRYSYKEVLKRQSSLEEMSNFISNLEGRGIIFNELNAPKPVKSIKLDFTRPVKYSQQDLQDLAGKNLVNRNLFTITKSMKPSAPYISVKFETVNNLIEVIQEIEKVFKPINLS